MTVNPEATFGHRFKQAVLSPFGWRWVPAREVAVVVREERFNRLELGPRDLWLAPGAERILFAIDIFPDRTRFSAEHVNTADGPQVDVVLQLEYHFEPWILDKNIQGQTCVRFKTPDAQREMVELAAQRAAQTVFGKMSSLQACAGVVSFKELEPELFDAVDASLKPVAISLLRPLSSIQRVECPETLKQKLEKMVEREMNIRLVEQHGPEKVGHSLRAEAVESLGKMTSGSPYLNVHDLTDTGTAGPRPLPPVIVEHVPTPPEPPPTPPDKPDEPDELESFVSN